MVNNIVQNIWYFRTSVFAIWFHLGNKIEKPVMPLPSRCFKSHCVILLHFSFSFTIWLSMFQIKAVPSACVPEWRQHQTEFQLTNGRCVERLGNKPLLFKASEIWELFLLWQHSFSWWKQRRFYNCFRTFDSLNTSTEAIIYKEKLGFLDLIPNSKKLEKNTSFKTRPGTTLICQSKFT